MRNSLKFLLLMIAAVMSLPVTFASFGGTIKFVFGEDFKVSQNSSVELSLLSAALAGVVAWLGSRSSIDSPRQKKQETQIHYQPHELIGIYGKTSAGFFITAALCFALFALLAPAMEEIGTGVHYFPGDMGPLFDETVKWVGGLSLMIGGVTLATGIFFSGLVTIVGIAEHYIVQVAQHAWGRLKKPSPVGDEADFEDVHAS